MNERTIVGKKVVVGGDVVDVELGEDPSDAEIIEQFDGADGMVTFVPPTREWEVVFGTRSGKVLREAGILVLGAPPVLGEPPRRASAEDLSERQVLNLVRGTFDAFWQKAWESLSRG